MQFPRPVSFLFLLSFSVTAWAQVSPKQNSVKSSQPATSKAEEPVKAPVGVAAGAPKPVATVKGQINLVWGKPITDNLSEENTDKTFLNMQGALYTRANHYLPQYFNHYKLSGNSNAATVTLANAKYEPLTEAELKVLAPDESFIPTSVEPQLKVVTERREFYANIQFIPIRKNPGTGAYEKLVSFSLDIHQNHEDFRTKRSPITFASKSVLSTGTWYKIGVTSDGVYKLTYSFLKKLGINMSTLVPANIRIYGNGGAMLPVSNAVYRPDDLLENAIYVYGQSDSVFKSKDYVLFYGQSPNVWTYNKTDQHFHHTVNLYTDTTYYFVNVDLGPGKRIGADTTLNSTPTNTVTTFDDYAYHELDGTNLIQSGNKWFGEFFETTTEYTISFNFPNIITTSTVYVNTAIASRKCESVPTDYNYYYVGPTPAGLVRDSMINVDCIYTDAYASLGYRNYTYTPSSSLVSVYITKLDPAAVGWLYFVEANARRQLTMGGQTQMEFRDTKSVGTGNVSQFNVAAINPIRVWDITNPQSIDSVPFQSTSGGNYQFELSTGSLRQFIAFSASGKNIDSNVANCGIVPNQNLHADSLTDLIIVTHPLYLSQANELAKFHREHDSLRVEVATTDEVYNEFSSGKQDPTAIRDFTMMFYNRAGNSYKNSPKYLLLFGDGSFDPKHRISGNNNYLVAYESDESFTPAGGTYVSDDYFVLLDSTVTTTPEGGAYTLDVAVGRLPADNVTEAQACVNKIISYETPTGQPVNATNNCCNTQTQYNLANWRNNICFIAHDGNDDMFQNYTEPMAALVDSNYRNLNVNKIYFDAYPLIQTPGGARYPAVNTAIDAQMNQGLLLFNYEGHGGPTGLGLERVLDFSDIYSWTNINALPLFFNGSCAFGEWDNPLQVSGGELTVTLATGGVIGMMSATREVFAEQNAQLNDSFISVLYSPLPDGSLPRMGDLLTSAKNLTGGSNLNNLTFGLLGDPAVRLNYPKYNIYTSSINAKTIASTPEDTLKALSRVTISGYVGDAHGNVLSSFNGLLNPTVFDKYTIYTTLDNLGGGTSPVENFGIQNSELYRGLVSVTNGKFSFSFVMPKDILYYYGFGKISYYAQNGITDGTGNYEKIIVGGTSPTAHNNGIGPKVRLYMNDSNFVYGGMTNQNPSLFAIVSDSNGINTSGTSIGHDITAVLDNNTANTYDISSYYQPSLNSYQRGTITFPLSGLSNGTHTLSLRVWNVYDNTSISTTEFNVEPQSSLQLQHVLNYPDPFTTHTQFYFEINEVCDVMDVQIQIFSVSGKLVRNILTSVKTDSFRSQPIDWDGKDDYGDKIARGVYIYHIKVRTSTGTAADTYQKLVIL